MDDETDAGDGATSDPDTPHELVRIERGLLRQLFPHLDPKVVAEVLGLEDTQEQGADDAE